MAISTSSSLLSRRLLLPRRLLAAPLRPFSSSSSLPGADSEADAPKPDSDQSSREPQSPNSEQARYTTRPLENGLDPGIYKAIILGKVGQAPVEKRLRSGRTLVLFSLGTGGMRNNRRLLDREEPHEYADRCSVQWHRVSVYHQGLRALTLEHAKTGSVLYLEGNLETKIFSDPMTGLVRRIREIAIRGDGRIVFLGNDSNAAQISDLRAVGYF